MFRRTLLATVAGAIPTTPLVPLTRLAERRETAVVDRIEGGTAVVSFDDGRQRTVAASVLPADARREGVVLRVPEGDALALASVDHAETRERRGELADRFDEFGERPDDASPSGQSEPRRPGSGPAGGGQRTSVNGRPVATTDSGP